MPPSLLVVDSPAPFRYTAVSVLRGAGALLFFVSWVVVLYHAGLILHAEWKLSQALERANEFATLPEVNPAELEQVVRDELALAGWNRAKVTLLRLPHVAGPSSYRVAKLEVSPEGVLPRWSWRLGLRLDRPLRAHLRDLPPTPSDSSWWGLN